MPASVRARLSKVPVVVWMVLAWLIVAITVSAMAFSGPTGWDVEVYQHAIQSVHRGGDPYAEGIAAQ